MVDTTSYENRYRKYLEDDVDTYLSDESSSTSKVITGGVAAAGLLGGGLLAYKKGLLKDLAHATISKMGKYRKGKIHGFNTSIRRFSEDEDLDKLGDAFKSLMRGDATEAVTNVLKFKDGVARFKDYVDDGKIAHTRRMKELMGSQLIDKEFEAHRNFSSSMRAIEDLAKEGVGDDVLHAARKEMNKKIYDSALLDPKEQKLKMKQSGFRFATIGDLIKAKEINETDEMVVHGMKLFEEAGKKGKEFLNTRADKNILIDANNQIADIRDFTNSFSGFINSLATDFTIPLVKINPLRMFYLDQLFSTATKPMFHVASAASRQPLAAGHNGSIQKPMLFADGDIFQFARKDGEIEANKVKGQFFLADSKKGPIARLQRNISGITISTFNKPSPDDPLLQRAKYHLGTFFDVGMQDEPAAQFDFLDPTSWAQGGINKVTGLLRQDKYQQREDYLSDAFGADEQFIFMRRYRTVGESESFKDYASQFTAGRKNLEDVTMATMFPYSFFERLNATLNQVNLGLSNKSLGSAFDVFSGLMLKRVAPIWAGMELWDYMNYESENFLGEQMSDRLAKMYENSSVEIAEMRDNLGITDWAKEVAPLFVGGEQITEIPLFGQLFNLDNNKEETQEYWENGEAPVRKGRWWGLGNTPYTGMTIDYYQPNWIRRTLSDYEYSDSLYGSREEYFQNSWMPSIRHPLAPIRHFITDPYHWEKKHYEDRPYAVTGGIPELENFPLIGPLLNATIGQLLKPSRPMHVDEYDKQVQEVAPTTQAMTVSPEVANYIAEKSMNAVTGADTVDDPSDDIPVTTPLSAQVDQQVQLAGQSVLSSTDGGLERHVEPEMQTVAYVTASGQTQLLEPESEDAISEAFAIKQKFSPMHTGQFQQARLEKPETEVAEAGLMNPLDMQQTASNLHYNMSEMGGFYGFVGGSITGTIAEDAQVLAKSSDMTSYSRAFWDMDVGGYGGDANEIFRRFLPKDRRIDKYNPIENTMPDFLPGEDYFIDFQHGDPYTKVKKGEMRLPGEGYERLYGIDMDKAMKLEIGASFIGYDDATIRDHLLKRDAYKEETAQQALKAGEKIHKEVKKDLVDKGVIEKTEEYVSNEESGIGGFYDMYGTVNNLLDWAKEQPIAEFKYYQAADGSKNTDDAYKGFYNEMNVSGKDQEAFMQELQASYGDQKYTGDIKTRSQAQFDKEGAHFENLQQVNFYSSELDTPINFIIEMNRDNPEQGIKVFAFEQNQNLLDYSVSKVDNVRQGIKQEMENGDLNRGDLYEPLDRYRILGDVAPYSAEFRKMKTQIRSMGLDEEQLEEVREIEDQVQNRKKKNRFYDYKFETANVEEELVTVDQVIDSNTFTTVEHPDNPIRLAGLRVSVAKDNPIAAKAKDVIDDTIKEGAKVRIAYDADESNRVKNDTYSTIQSVVYDQKGQNLNRYLIENELAKEKETDWSPAAVHARFSESQISFGALWEKFAHMDTMLHTKLLQVRSPLESYERREVYGKDWQEWQDPIDDFLIPSIQNAMTHNPIVAIAGGAFIGAGFGSLKATDLGADGKVMGRYGKIVGGVAGASIMAGAIGYKMLSEAITGEAWIPERRKEERDVEEYFDVLKYIKYNKLFDQYAELAKDKEGFDVESYLEKNKDDGELRKKKTKDLQDIKRKLYAARPNQVKDMLHMLNVEYGLQASTKEEAMKLINKEVNTMQGHREIQKLTPLASKAILYKQASQQTMYGYESGDPIANILAALPKKDRDYLVPFTKAPEKERQRILDIVPDYMKRPLQSAWGLPVDEKEKLDDFFKEHPLPSKNWDGWKENISLDEVKVKYVDRVGLDPSEFDIWPDGLKRAKANPADIPNVKDGKEDAESYAYKMRQMFGNDYLKDLNVVVEESDQPGHHVTFDIRQNRQQEVKDLINRDGSNVI